MWISILPCDEDNYIGDEYFTHHYLGNFADWNSASQGSFKVGDVYYKTLDEALNNAVAGQSIEMLDNPSSAVSGVLKDGVTLVNTDGSKYTANGGDAQIKVNEKGEITIINTGNGQVHCSSGASCTVDTGSGSSKTVSSNSPGGYDVVVPSSGSPYITGINGGNTLSMDNANYVAPGDSDDTSGKLYLPDPLAADTGCTEAVIDAYKAANIQVPGGVAISTDGTNNAQITVNKNSDGTIIKIPSGNKINVGGKEYMNDSDTDLYINVDFETFVTQKFNEVNSKHQNGESAEIKKLIDEALTDITDYKYDINKDINENKKVINDIIKKLDDDISLQEDKEAFEKFQQEKIDELKKSLENETSDEVKKLINDAIEEIANTNYDTQKDLDANKAVIDNIIANLDEAKELQKNKEAFEQYKNDIKNQIDEMLDKAASEDEKKLINKALEELDKTVYDEEKSLDDNKNMLDDLISNLNNDIDKMNSDKEAYEQYKNEKISEVNQMLAGETNDKIKQLINSALEDINNASYDVFKSLDQNKAVIDNIISGLNSDINDVKLQSVPNTGDNSYFGVYICLMMVSLAVLVLSIILRKRAK